MSLIRKPHLICIRLEVINIRAAGLSFNLKEILLNNLRLISEYAIYYLALNNMMGAI